MSHEDAGHTLQTTALINEAYLRLVDARSIHWHDRAHFLAIAAKLMRQILVDFARTNSYQKRGGGLQQVTLNDDQLLHSGEEEDLVRLDDALNALAKFDPRKARVVELRFFGGLTAEETAEVLKVARITVMRDWKMAKLWLLKELQRD